MPFEVYLSEDAERDIVRLDAVQRRRLNAWVARLREDPMIGDQIPRARIPRMLARKYLLSDLWRVELPGGWRLPYTILTSPHHEPMLSIVRVIDHGAYDRLFGYKSS